MERDNRWIVKRLRDDSFVQVSVNGSHHKFVRDGRIVIVPHPKKDIPVGTARAIAKAAGWIE